MIRAFADPDWALVWPIFRSVVDAGDTYAYDPNWSSDDARRTWVEPPPAHTVVSVEGAAVLGTAKMGPNRPGRGSHVATASFMASLGCPDDLGTGDLLLGDVEVAEAGIGRNNATVFEVASPPASRHSALGAVRLGRAEVAEQRDSLGSIRSDTCPGDHARAPFVVERVCPSPSLVIGGSGTQLLW